jgi:nucleoside-diphosphate-sugar epimerase
MKAYITGANGFIGKNLIKKLEGDVTAVPHDEITTTKYKPFDYFFFLSTFGNMYHHEGDLKVFQANVLDPLYVIQQVKDIKFKCFVYISTSSVRLKTQTMYSRAKKATEEILLSHAEKYNLPICIIRPFSITGVGEQKEHLIPQLIRSCMEKEQINFVPHPRHDFIDVQDVVDGLINLAEHKARGIFELGTGKEYTNQEVLEKVEKITGRKANINKVESLRSYDADTWVSLNYKARSYGWLPKKTLDDSIKEMVAEYMPWC